MLNRVPTQPHADASRSAYRRENTDGPPRLRLHLMHHLKVLMLLNIVPLLGGLYLWWQWSQGKLSLSGMNEESRATMVVVLVCCVAFAVISWFVLPLARWLRDYPTWHIRRGPVWAWIIPTASGWLAWGVLSVVGIVGAAVSILICVIAIVHLFQIRP
jgi:hypothetical protein